jgi:hypothetical protein
MTPYVMPNFYTARLPLAERVRSTSFGDSASYGGYAESLLQKHAFQDVSGMPAVQHMPGLPLILAATVELFGSLDGFRVVQILFFFLSLHFFLLALTDKFPSIVLASTVVVMALHPSMATLFTAVMSDVLFTSMLLWVAFVLYGPNPSYLNFLGAGILLGLAVYLRESAFAFVAAVGLAYIVKDARMYFRPVALMACVFAVLLSPWVLRNYIQTGHIIPLTTKGITMFYRSSFPVTTEFYSARLDKFELRKMDARFTGTPPTSEALAVAIHNYVSRPREQATSMLLKTVALFNKPALLQRPLSRRATAALAAFNVAYYLFHVGIILMGVLLAFSKHAKSFPYLPYIIAAQYVQAMLLWSETRYLVPVYPFVVIIALTWYLERGKALLARGRIRGYPGEQPAAIFQRSTPTNPQRPK